MPTTSSARWLAGMTAGVIALGVIAVIVTLVASSGDPEPLPPGSPEARVQDFILAIDDGAFDVAYDMLAPAATDECTQADFRRHIADGQRAGLRVQLDSVDLYGDEADVTVNVTSLSGSPPFDFSESKQKARFTLSRTGDRWVVTEAPWPFSGCPFPRVKPTATPTPTPTLQPTASPATL